MKELSFIVPVYNVEDYLDECILSLLDVNDIDYEILIINDGSKDSSLEIAQKYQLEYPNKVKIITQENKGLSVARNTGIANSSGEFIMFIDSDDFIIPEKFSSFWKQSKILNIDVCIGNYVKLINDKFVKHKYNFFKSCSVRRGIITGMEYTKYMYDYLHDQYDTECVTQIYRRNFLIENNIRFAPGIIHEDTLFMFEVFMNAKTVKVWNDEFYVYRMRNNSIMHSLGEEHYTSMKYIVESFSYHRNKKMLRSRYIDSYIISMLYEIRKNKDVYGEIININEIIKKSKNLTLKSWAKKLIIKYF